jgi:hypothetical protein
LQRDIAESRGVVFAGDDRPPAAVPNEGSVGCGDVAAQVVLAS